MLASHFRCGLNHFIDAVTVVTTQIEYRRFAAVIQMINREYVCACQIVDVDVVTDTGAVRRVIILPE